MLAGLPKAPSAYNPIVNPKRATTRQQYIIDRMLENGFITAEQREAARAEKLRYRTAGRSCRCMPNTWPRRRASSSSPSTATRPTRAA